MKRFRLDSARPVSGLAEQIYSLAALLADSHKVPWAGAFDLGDGLWWYIAVRDNYGLMPDGDVVGTFEDIQQARQTTRHLRTSTTLMERSSNSRS